MGYRIIRNKTKYGIQIAIYHNKNGETKYIKTIGTAKNELELKILLETANKYVDKIAHTFFADPNFDLNTLKSKENPPIILSEYKILKITYEFAYKELEKVYNLILNQANLPELFKHLCILRIINPSSKREAVYLLKKLFDLNYTLNQIYYLKNTISELKSTIIESIFKSTNKDLNRNFKLVFYDVTTIYFESFTEDDLKKCGFSKDLKFNQPQLVLGLLVDKTGFPITYELYEGNKFEGHTFIPVIKACKNQFKIDKLTVVADAGMMSKISFEELEKEELK